MTDIQDWLNSNDYETHDPFKFSTIGDKIRGEIVETPRIVETPDLNDKTKTTQKLVVAIRNEADGETYTVWIKSGLMGKALAAAVKEAGATQLAEGGTLGLAYTGDGTASKPGFNPPKQYAATYSAPSAGVNPDDIFG